MKTTWHETEDGAAVVVADGKQIARCNVFDPFGQDAVNALRISVCLNACAGTSNSDLADIQHYGGVERLFTYWQEAQKQRDELQAENTRLQIALHNRVITDGEASLLYRLTDVRNRLGELMKAAKNYADCYLRDERDDRSLCIDQQHHEDVLALFDAVAKAEAK